MGLFNKLTRDQKISLFGHIFPAVLAFIGVLLGLSVTIYIYNKSNPSPSVSNSNGNNSNVANYNKNRNVNVNSNRNNNNVITELETIPDLAGEWEGSFNHKKRTFHYHLSLVQNRTQVSGHAKITIVIEATSYYADMRLYDGVLSENELTFKEEKINWAPLPKSDWCEKICVLKWDNAPVPQTMTGNWRDPACDESARFEDVSGSITLKRVSQAK